jgi:hypothetical protein
MFISIWSIMQKGEKSERAFFQFLSLNNISWTQVGSNLNRIYLLNPETDLPKVKKMYPEVRPKKDMVLFG